MQTLVGRHPRLQNVIGGQPSRAWIIAELATLGSRTNEREILEELVHRRLRITGRAAKLMARPPKAPPLRAEQGPHLTATQRFREMPKAAPHRRPPSRPTAPRHLQRRASSTRPEPRSAKGPKATAELAASIRLLEGCLGRGGSARTTMQRLRADLIEARRRRAPRATTRAIEACLSLRSRKNAVARMRGVQRAGRAAAKSEAEVFSPPGSGEKRGGRISPHDLAAARSIGRGRFEFDSHDEAQLFQDVLRQHGHAAQKNGLIVLVPAKTPGDDIVWADAFAFKYGTASGRALSRRARERAAARPIRAARKAPAARRAKRRVRQDPPHERALAPRTPPEHYTLYSKDARIDILVGTPRVQHVPAYQRGMFEPERRRGALDQAHWAAYYPARVRISWASDPERALYDEGREVFVETLHRQPRMPRDRVHDVAVEAAEDFVQRNIRDRRELVDYDHASGYVTVTWDASAAQHRLAGSARRLAGEAVPRAVLLRVQLLLRQAENERGFEAASARAKAAQLVREYGLKPEDVRALGSGGRGEATRSLLGGRGEGRPLLGAPGPARLGPKRDSARAGWYARARRTSP